MMPEKSGRLSGAMCLQERQQAPEQVPCRFRVTNLADPYRRKPPLGRAGEQTGEEPLCENRLCEHLFCKDAALLAQADLKRPEHITAELDYISTVSGCDGYRRVVAFRKKLDLAGFAFDRRRGK